MASKIFKLIYGNAERLQTFIDGSLIKADAFNL
jgi:hypothetical protein